MNPRHAASPKPGRGNGSTPLGEHRVEVRHKRRRADRTPGPGQSATRSSAAAGVAPASSAIRDASWITGPSITGSENGMPTSIACAPTARSPEQQIGIDAGRPAGHVRDEGFRSAVATFGEHGFEASRSCGARQDHILGVLRSHARTVSRSLSPRPERQTSDLSCPPAGAASAASRSRAPSRAPGRMPSVRASAWNPRAPRRRSPRRSRAPGVLEVRRAPGPTPG